MKVLFVGATPPAEAGGAHGFMSTVKAALEKAQSDHTLHFADGNKPGYDFTWYLGPSNHFATCDTPFAFSVWDLGHRTMPWFPEVSLSGWKFESRHARYRDALPRASITVCSSEKVAEQCRYYYHPNPDSIIVLPEPPSPVFGQAPGDWKIVRKHGLEFTKYLLYPAQFWPHKNHIAAIDALGLIDADFKLVFTGSDKGNQKYIEAYVHENSLTDRVIFAGFVTVPELIGLYENAFATVVPTFMPACSLPVFEAGACGCPVIEETTAEKIAGWVKVLKNPTARQVEIEAGRFNAKRFNADNYAARVITALNAFYDIRRLWGRGYVHL